MSVPARSRVADALVDIQAPVRPLLDRVPDEMWRIIAGDAPLLAQVSEHLMGMRGKMFRPTLTLLSASVENEPDPHALTVAAIAELIHLATLVHDDSVDHSALRRGMPTINSLFSHQVAVITGDYLYIRALAELVELETREPLRVFMRASREMTLGEMNQIVATSALGFDEEGYYSLIRAKTASLFSSSCEVGAIYGAPEHRKALARYGDQLGMAFQIADDLLDYTAVEEITGKPSGHDLREHKVTLPLIAAMRNMADSDIAIVRELFAECEPSDAGIADVVALVRSHGGLEYARQQGEAFARNAEAALVDIPRGPAHSALVDAIAYVMDRRW